VNSESWNDLIESLIREGILQSPAVIRAMRLVPRDKFLPEDSKSYGAVDSPLPIGWGQTVSAPHGKPERLLGETWFR
jgi:protein-L-isoaspartate(D-aspartate) O-methyltransferase